MPVRLGAFEIQKRGVARFDWRDPYHLALEVGWPSFFLGVLALDLLINMAFAVLYWLQPGSILNARPRSLLDSFFFSMETLATVGYGVMAPQTLYGHCVAAVELLCGVFFTAIMTGLIFVRFSRPRAKILYADKPVVGHYNGTPTLMIRIGNGRRGVLADARAQLGVLIVAQTDEGQFFRRVRYLDLSNPRIPIFPLTWTLLHRIDEKSPLAGYDAERLVAEDVRMFLIVEARDYALAAPVHDTRYYAASDVLFGMRYADAVSIDTERRTVADLTRISLTEPDGSESSGVDPP